MAISSRQGLRKGFLEYLLSRGSTFAFMGVFMGGLALGSLFCVSTTDGAELLRSIVANDLALQQDRNLWELLVAALSGFAGIFVFLYLCLNSRKGAVLIYIVPLIQGLSVGSVITAVLAQDGYGALRYIALCIFLPKAVETLLLLSVCNKTARYCKEHFSGQSARKGRGSGFPILLYFIVFGAYFVLESLLIYLFRGLR